MFSEAKVTEIYCLADDFCKEFAKYQEKHMFSTSSKEAIAQANSYAETERVKSSVGHTTLHKIVIVYRGMEMVVCEEIPAS